MKSPLTRSRRGHTPIVAVSGAGSGRVSIAGLICLKPGHRTGLIYRAITHQGRKNERKGFRENDYAALLDAADLTMARRLRGLRT